MLRISAKRIWIHKKLSPIFMFGFLALFLLVGMLSGAVAEQPMFLVIPIVIGAFGFYLHKFLVWDLVDEVLDDGDYLVVRNRGEEERVALADIMNVNASMFTNPPRITLRLRYQSRFGSEVAFSPDVARSWNPFAKNPIVEELITRVDRARLTARNP
jgi:hypothetical protein